MGKPLLHHFWATHHQDPLGKIINSANSDKHKTESQKQYDTGHELQEVFEGTRKLTSTLMFQSGGTLNKTALDVTVGYTNAIKQKLDEKDEIRAVKRLKLAVQ